jgi:hypothetical protein
VCCSAPVNKQAFAFEIRFPPEREVHELAHARLCVHMSLILQEPNPVLLAAADDVTRQRCMGALQAATTYSASSSLLDIASAAAITQNLTDMQSFRALNAVMAALGKTGVGGLDLNRSVDFNLRNIMLAMSLEELQDATVVSCELHFARTSTHHAYTHTLAREQTRTATFSAHTHTHTHRHARNRSQYVLSIVTPPPPVFSA